MDNFFIKTTLIIYPRQRKKLYFPFILLDYILNRLKICNCPYCLNSHNKQVVLELKGGFDMIITWVGLRLSYVFEYSCHNTNTTALI